MRTTQFSVFNGATSTVISIALVAKSTLPCAATVNAEAFSAISWKIILRPSIRPFTLGLIVHPAFTQVWHLPGDGLGHIDPLEHRGQPFELVDMAIGRRRGEGSLQCPGSVPSLPCAENAPSISSFPVT